MVRPRPTREVVTIYWRDIPAQVNGSEARGRHQILLPDRFQRAIERAKRKARIHTATEDVAQWRRISRTVDGDVAVAAQAEADRLIAEHSPEQLGMLAYVGGWRHDLPSEAPDGPRHDTGERAANRDLDGRATLQEGHAS